MCLNIQDLLPKKSVYGSSDFKIDYLRHMCSQQVSPKLICLVVTKLCQKIDNSEADIAGYCMHRKDRNRRGGGVMINYRDSLDVTQLKLQLNLCAAFESVAVKVTSRLKNHDIRMCPQAPPIRPIG